MTSSQQWSSSVLKQLLNTCRMAVSMQVETGNFTRLMVRNLPLKCARKKGKGCFISLVAGTSLELMFTISIAVDSVTCVL